jgi:hypothetical protein
MVVELATGTLDPANIGTYDGGDAGSGLYHGPMWALDSESAALFTLHPGTLPTSGLVIGDGDTGGEEQHALTLNENAAHTHTYRKGTSVPPLNTAGGPDLNMARQWDDNAVTGSSGLGHPHNTMPPYLCRLKIVRTTRQYYWRAA